MERGVLGQCRVRDLREEEESKIHSVRWKKVVRRWMLLIEEKR